MQQHFNLEEEIKKLANVHIYDKVKIACCEWGVKNKENDEVLHEMIKD